jgi:hypothetical protein
MAMPCSSGAANSATSRFQASRAATPCFRVPIARSAARTDIGELATLLTIDTNYSGERSRISRLKYSREVRSPFCLGPRPQSACTLIQENDFLGFPAALRNRKLYNLVSSLTGFCCGCLQVADCSAHHDYERQSDSHSRPRIRSRKRNARWGLCH